MNQFSSIEICAGAGGQALGLEQAGFGHEALVEIDQDACRTLRYNRPEWTVIGGDVAQFSASQYKGIDLFAGGVPCPPFSKAGKQLGKDDERDLFPQAMRLVSECRPKAVMLENVRGLLDPAFAGYREELNHSLERMGYVPRWKLLQASSFGVPQLRPRVILVALPREYSDFFDWPDPSAVPPLTVGKTLRDLMGSKGWGGVAEWSQKANAIAPTIVGGSKKHGGPDLGPTRAKRAWAELGVDGCSIADAPPEPEFKGMPRLTVQMVARIQGFSDIESSIYKWTISGRKTAAYRQVGNAFPPPVAHAVGRQIRLALEAGAKVRVAHVPSYVSIRPEAALAGVSV